uniref:Uncharacterized protein n=1 Tax=Anguilla anguilla TaxID=7936 RepID=A0A0E9R701_ANGAN
MLADWDYSKTITYILYIPESMLALGIVHRAKYTYTYIYTFLLCIV